MEIVAAMDGNAVATSERVEDQRKRHHHLAQDVHVSQDYAEVQLEFTRQVERADGERLRIASEERERSQAIVAAQRGPMNAAFKQVDELKLQVATLRHQLERSRAGEDADELKSEDLISQRIKQRPSPIRWKLLTLTWKSNSKPP